MCISAAYLARELSGTTWKKLSASYHLSNLPNNASKIEIKNQITVHDKALHREKMELTKNVPIKALSGFANKGADKISLDSSAGRMIAYYNHLNQTSRQLPYTFGNEPGLKRKLTFSPDWIRTTSAGSGKASWTWPPSWTSSKTSQSKKAAVDHFIPWSFVMNDELWNLMPMDSSLNSSKSNKLPKWSPFFPRFAENQYLLYQMIHDTTRPQLRKLYENCCRDNLHSIWANQELYRGGNSRGSFVGFWRGICCRCGRRRGVLFFLSCIVFWVL